MLILGEVAPKTIAALHPARVALPAALIYYPLLKITYPVVWLLNLVANGLLRLLGVRADQIASHSLSAEELRTVVAEAGVMVPRRHREMLLSILDLDAITVDDIMVPRQEIVGLDLDRTWQENLAVIQASRHDRLPVYRATSTTSSAWREFASCYRISCAASSRRRCCSSAFASRTSYRKARR